MTVARTRIRTVSPAVAALVLAGIAWADVERVSLRSAGGEANGNSVRAAIAGKGRFVVFHSTASDLVPDDANNVADVFVRDLTLGTTTRVSVSGTGAEANGACFDARISDDGRWISFTSSATNLVPDDTNNVDDVFVHDVKTGETRRVSVRSDGGEANDESYGPPQISGNGRYVVFDSDATNLVDGDTNTASDVFVHDLKTHTTVRASVGPNGEETARNYGAFSGQISKNGRYVGFTTATDAFDGDQGRYGPVVRDMKTGRILRPSRVPGGGYVDESTYFWALSANGKVLAYTSPASNVTPLGSNGFEQAYVVSLKTGQVTLLSVAPDGALGNDHSYFPRLSASGRIVAFSSKASNLASGDANGAFDAFVADTAKRTLLLLSRTPSGATGNGRNVGVDLTSNGRTAVFDSQASDLVANDGNAASDIFIAPTR